jgi:hypothetical protein
MNRLSFHKANSEFRYDEKTGTLWWRKPREGRRLDIPAGRRQKNRHVTVSLDYVAYQVPHIIWLLKTGKWPTKELDHKNTIRWDNRWNNLREATPTQNRANSSRRKDNSSGMKGVSWHAPRKKWRARIMLGRKETHLGLFDSKEAAQRIYIKAAKKYFREFARAA